MILTEQDLLPNYLALWVAIERQLTSAEMAFRITDDLLDNPFRAKRSLLTDEDSAHMTELRAQGMQYKEIGDMYGVTDTAIWRRIEKHNGGVIPVNRAKKVSPEDVQEMLRLKRTGMTYKQIADKFGVVPNTVWFRISKIKEA